MVESYVLGLASPEERAEFEELCRQYPQLVAAREAFESSLEKQAREGSVPPPSGVRSSFLSFLESEASGAADPGKPGPAPVIDLEPGPGRRQAGLRWLVAASLFVALGTAYLAYRLYHSNQALQQTNRDLQARLQSRDSLLDQLAEEQRVMHDPNVTVVNMVGTQKAPLASASIYWDSTSSNVWMIVKNLPRLPSEKQYQLWALIDGKPKDLGLFDATGSRILLKMNNTRQADAFAITIENRGHSGPPTLETLQTLGKAKL
ncbi:MAG TPA: anti-sigma factor [Chitinophagaceae bacterium]|nr:anti-sigma factor [Chitinophagaceae bacterium]